MTSTLQSWRESKTLAHVVPFVAFMLFLPLADLLSKFGFAVKNPELPWYRYAPEQWIFPLQAIICFAIVLFFWKQYDLKPVRGLPLAIVAALVGIAVWILPGFLFKTHGASAKDALNYLGYAERTDGFNPTFIRDDLGSVFWFWFAVVLRFFRMVVVVALIEEIFWRGFLMRFLLKMDGDYWKVPFGKFHWMSLVVITVLFMGIHAPVDWLGALVYGLLTYLVAVRTKSLTACVVMHAVANFALGIYTMSTGQWGYW